jgi:hypothetical protein
MLGLFDGLSGRGQSRILLTAIAQGKKILRSIGGSQRDRGKKSGDSFWGRL